MSMNQLRFWAFGALSLWAAGTAAASESNPTAPRDVVLRIERLALFKNGLGYATATAQLPEGARTVRLGQLPVPSYGTFWIAYPKEVKVRGLVTAMETVDETATASSLDQLLRLNPGRKVLVHVAASPGVAEVVLEGVVKPTVKPETPEPPSPYFMDFRRPADRGYPYGYPPPAQNSLVLLQTDKGLVALNPLSIQRVDFGVGEPVCVTTNQQKRPAIRMELEEPAGGQRVEVGLLARGITWVPSYRIDLSDEETAHFSAQAQIVNELADIQDAHVDLVTGFPNIQFPELPNPVAMSQNLAEFLRSLAAGRAESRERGYMMGQQAIAGWGGGNYGAYDNALLPSYGISTNGQTAEDLFLYPLPRVSLKKGETATLPLFSADMSYRHLYTWKIADPLDADHSGPRGDGRLGPRGDGRSAEEVWHTCRLVNSARMPLTTAPAEFVEHGQFVGQDTCFYTAAGAEASIRINRALNVQADQAEVEIERKRNAANFYGFGYDLVKLTGELKVRNRLDKPIDLEITKELSGEVLEKSDSAQDVQTARGLKQVNPKHLLTWTIALKPDEERKITYSYQLYVRP
jgi:hypothetical protein